MQGCTDGSVKCISETLWSIPKQESLQTLAKLFGTLGEGLLFRQLIEHCFPSLPGRSAWQVSLQILRYVTTEAFLRLLAGWLHGGRAWRLRIRSSVIVQCWSFRSNSAELLWRIANEVGFRLLETDRGTVAVNSTLSSLLGWRGSVCSLLFSVIWVLKYSRLNSPTRACFCTANTR